MLAFSYSLLYGATPRVSVPGTDIAPGGGCCTIDVWNGTVLTGIVAATEVDIAVLRFARLREPRVKGDGHGERYL